jgi:hypothetical protein
LLAERAERLTEVQGDSFAADFIFTVRSKTNYEGNYVAFMNLRQRGSDEPWQVKVVLQQREGAWVVTKKEETKIH